jgi:hypothetical protein
MTLIELTAADGHKYLFDMESQWEIHDQGKDKPAFWTNYVQARNMDAVESYTAIEYKLDEHIQRGRP